MVYDEEKDLFRFTDGRFAFSREHAHCGLLSKWGWKMHKASRRGTMYITFGVRIDCWEVSGERGVQEPTASTCKNGG